jgi:hypothetical protein
MGARSLRLGLASFAALALAACFGGGPRLLAPEDAGAAAPVDFGDAAAADVATDVDLGDPFAVLGLQPAHGPWRGGTHAIIRGRGFTSKMHVLVGGKPVDPSAIVASDPTRVAIVTPEGAPGPADVTVANDATADARTLSAGFFYDAFVVDPESGASTGGTRVRLEGRGTSFAAGSTVRFGSAECADVAVKSATEIECTTPAGSIGPVSVVVASPGAADVPARDAFTYTDRFDPSRGGLSGGALSGSLRVDVLDGATGLPIPGAHVIAGDSIASGVVGTTAATGSVVLSGASLSPKVTVTVAAKCHQPTTYVDVPVDTVTVYLDPVIDLSCAELQDPPSSGGRGFRYGGVVQGELVWPGGVEFKRGDWDNVPKPVRATERMAAYVFLASGSPQAGFSLPAATAATTPESLGGRGYAYEVVAPPGNVTLYALAGIEDRSTQPPRFSAFAMGVARGVAVAPNQSSSGIDIAMNVLVDHQLALSSQPPPVTSRGPDRLVASLAVSVGPSLYAALPEATQTRLLPFPGTITFAPLPSLDGALANEAYVVGATAVTSPTQSAPASVVSRVRVTDANVPVSLGGFLPVPAMIAPGASAFSGTHVEIGAQGAYDLLVVLVSSGGGLSSWTIVAPSGRASFDLPDLAALPDAVGLKHGPITSTAYVARLGASFSYGALRSGDLASSNWTAYAWDSLTGSY